MLCVCQFIEGLTILFLVIYLLYISNYYQGWYWFGFGMQILIVIGMFWLPESPDFFYSKGRFEESKEVMLWIGRVNGITIDPEHICFGNFASPAKTSSSPAEDLDVQDIKDEEHEKLFKEKVANDERLDTKQSKGGDVVSYNSSIQKPPHLSVSES